MPDAYCRRTLLRVLLLAIVVACIASAPAVRAAAEPKLPAPIEPLSPAESAAQIEVPAGYRVELVASEPDIEEPTLCVFDANGRMYVAEMLSYMQDTEGTATKEFRGSRVKRLEDTDGDGRMDKVTVFAEGLVLPRMVLPLDDRVIIQETDNQDLVMYRDTDGDGRSDEKQTVWKAPNLVHDSVEHQDSGLLWNIDNWMYTAEGGRRHRFTNGTWVTERCQAQGDNQWGLGMDDEGTLFFSHNSFPGRGFQQPWYAWSLWQRKSEGKVSERPSLVTGYGETDAAFQQLYPIHAVADRHDNGIDRKWTSACGISIYRGDAMPDLYGDMFLCEPCGHLVRRATIVVTDGKKQLRNAHEDEQREFFASKDFYSRPVWTATGPDGCLYVVDMYRGIIQDKPWVDAKYAERLKALGADRVIRKGRIWRIVPEGFTHAKPESLLEMTSEQLMTKLADPNGWKRDQAQKLLVLRSDKGVVPALETIAASHAAPIARLHALWTLEGLGSLTKPVVFTALGDADPRVRCAAIRFTEAWLKEGDAESLAKVMPLADDAEITVRRQLILSLGWSTRPEALTTIEKVIGENLDNEIIYLAAMTAIWNQPTPFTDRLLAGTEFNAIKDPGLRNAARQRWKRGILSWRGMKSTTRQLDAEAAKLVDIGAGIYTGLCAQCHAPNGQGMQPPDSPKMAPPLDGSPRVVGQKERLVRLVLHGMVGDVDGKQYKGGIMAPIGSQLTDRMLAAVLTYTRLAWSNDAAPITPGDVAKIRAASADRKTPWTLEELDRYAAPLLGGTGLAGKENDSVPWKGYVGDNRVTGLTAERPPDRRIRGPWLERRREPGLWFALDLLKPTEVTAINLLSTRAEWSPVAWEVRTSSDGVTWSEPIAQGTGGHQTTSVSFDPVVSRFFKITETGTSSQQDRSRWQVMDYRLYGRAADGVAETPSVPTADAVSRK